MDQNIGRYQEFIAQNVDGKNNMQDLTKYILINTQTNTEVKIDDCDKYFIDMYGGVHKIEWQGNTFDLILQTHLKAKERNEY